MKRKSTTKTRKKRDIIYFVFVKIPHKKSAMYFKAVIYQALSTVAFFASILLFQKLASAFIGGAKLISFEVAEINYESSILTAVLILDALIFMSALSAIRARKYFTEIMLSAEEVISELVVRKMHTTDVLDSSGQESKKSLSILISRDARYGGRFYFELVATLIPILTCAVSIVTIFFLQPKFGLLLLFIISVLPVFLVLYYRSISKMTMGFEAGLLLGKAEKTELLNSDIDDQKFLKMSSAFKKAFGDRLAAPTVANAVGLLVLGVLLNSLIVYLNLEPLGLEHVGWLVSILLVFSLQIRVLFKSFANMVIFFQFYSRCVDYILFGRLWSASNGDGFLLGELEE